MEITLGISNRHIHLTKENYVTLFGTDEVLIDRPLTQPGMYASKSYVTIKGPKGEIEHVRFLGPFRSYDQVEISKTDSFKLGVNPPVRNSGDLEGSAPITIIGPKGSVELSKGCIIAARHIHITPKDMKEFGLEGIDTVRVRLNGEKGGIIDNVSLKVAEESFFELHIDTDDGNGHLVKQGDTCTILTDED